MADGLLVGVGGNGGDLGHQAHDGQFGLVRRLIHFGQLRVVGRHGAHRRRQDGHRVSTRRKTVDEFLQALVDHRVARDLGPERQQLGLGRQVAVDQQVGRFGERGLLGHLLDRNAAIAQNALLAVQKRYGTGGGTGVHIGRVHGDVTGFGAQFADIDRFFAF